MPTVRIIIIYIESLASSGMVTHMPCLMMVAGSGNLTDEQWISRITAVRRLDVHGSSEHHPVPASAFSCCSIYAERMKMLSPGHGRKLLARERRHPMESQAQWRPGYPPGRGILTESTDMSVNAKLESVRLSPGKGWVPAWA